MGKQLETFALNHAIEALGLNTPSHERLLVNKRSTLYKIILEDIGDLVMNWEADLDEGETTWAQFKKIVPGLPDGIVVDRENCVAYFLEVEDTHPLNEDKLTAYSWANYHLDYVYWRLELITTDRYGNPHPPKDLLAWLFHMMNRDGQGKVAEAFSICEPSPS